MHKRGFTLIELMIVVAIIGVLSGIAAVNIQLMVAQGVVNGGANTTARMLANARLRALAMRCPVFVQINGPTYLPPMGALAGFPGRENTVFVLMKGNCSSINSFYEGDGPAGIIDDKVIAEFNLDPRLAVWFPAGVVAAPGKLTNESVTIGWAASPVTPKVVMVDPGGGYAVVPSAGLFEIRLRAQSDNSRERKTTVPDTGIAYTD